MLSRSRTLIRALNPRYDLVHRISTFPFLSQEAQLAAESSQPQSTPMPPQNVRNAYPQPPSPPPGQGYLIPINHSVVSQMQALSRTLDSKGLKDLFAEWTTENRWFDVKQLYEVWVTCLDSDGKHNKPDVGLFNFYLRANLRTGASPANLLDLVCQVEDFGLKPNTASYNLVLKGMRAELEATVKLLERMLIGGKESLPDDESYDLVLGSLFQRKQVDVGVKYLDRALKSGYKMSMQVFDDFIVSCLYRGKLDSLVSIIEQCKKMEQNKVLCPNWSLCNEMADVGIQKDHAQLVYNALHFLAKWIRIGENEKPPVRRAVDQGLLVAAISSAGRTYSPKLLDASRAILERITMQANMATSPEYFLAKIHAYCTLGNLPKAFGSLRELEAAYGNSDGGVLEELLSPFTCLNPLVLACSRKGFTTLDEVYYQLENLMRADPPYKSLAALNCIVLGCANIWDEDRAYQTFCAITSSFGLIPDIHSYNSLICAFTKLNERDKAINVFDHFVGLGVKPNATTYSLLVDVHLTSRDPKAAISAIEEMIQQGYKPSKETLRKVRRRCVREWDNESNNKVEALFKQLDIHPGTENRRNMLFNAGLNTTQSA